MLSLTLLAFSSSSVGGVFVLGWIFCFNSPTFSSNFAFTFAFISSANFSALFLRIGLTFFIKVLPPACPDKNDLTSPNVLPMFADFALDSATVLIAESFICVAEFNPLYNVE